MEKSDLVGKLYNVTDYLKNIPITEIFSVEEYFKLGSFWKITTAACTSNGFIIPKDSIGLVEVIEKEEVVLNAGPIVYHYITVSFKTDTDRFRFRCEVSFAVQNFEQVVK